MHVDAPLIYTLLERAWMRESPYHGERHWRQVAQVGWYLGDADPRVDLDVVFLFAVLHDSRRQNENGDPNHGPRAARRANALVQAPYPLAWLRDSQWDLLNHALYYHTDGETSDDPTVGACWDADRLTLPRVYTAVKLGYLSTEYARRPYVRGWAAALSRFAGWAESVPLLSWVELVQVYRALEVRRLDQGLDTASAV